MKLLVAVCMIFSSLFVSASGNDSGEEKVRTVLSVIDSATGEPLIGADVHIVGSDEVFYTDPDGNVEIEHRSEVFPQIRVSYISYKDVTITLADSSPLVLLPLLSR